MRPLALPVALVLALFAAPLAALEPPRDSAAIDSVLAGDWREAKNAARDVWRHPRETLGFFGVKPDQTVVEISPGGGGWYAELLVPYLRAQGRYIGVVTDPARTSSERARDYNATQNQLLRDKFAARADVYDRATLVEIDPQAPVLGDAGSADAVLTFRNVHNWMMAGNADKMFAGFFAVLKPGGVLGVVEHRANADVPAGDRSGYVSEAQVIALATAAGFVLDARSEINANPRDTKDHPDGVWMLPPANRHPPERAAHFAAIGESDRMTLRFVKPNPTP
jgi:predicted methyltransferase